MKGDFDLSSRAYWEKMGWGIVLSLTGALSALMFVSAVTVGHSFIMPYTGDISPFSGSPWIVVLMTGAGLMVGILNRYTPAGEMDVFEALNRGYLDPEPVPSSVMVSLISLVGGFSLGPEVTTGMLAGGTGAWISEKRKLDPEKTRINVISSISGAWSGLFTSPSVMILVLLESKHKQSVVFYGTLLIALISAVIGFAIFYVLQDYNYAHVLGLLSPPVYKLEIWHLGVSILLGILAVPVALIFIVLNKIFKRFIMPLKGKPVIRSTLGGFLIGLLAVAVPTTFGLGTETIPVITEQAAEIGFILLLVFAFTKLVALSGALNFGFIGGPIFPLLFAGSCLGNAIHQIFPQIPPGLALGCMMVAVPAALVPVPLSLAILVILVIGLSPLNALPVFLAALVAFSITRGLLLKGVEE